MSSKAPTFSNTPADVAGGVTETPPADEEMPAGHDGGHRWRLVLVAASVVIVLVAAVVFAAVRDDDDETSTSASSSSTALTTTTTAASTTASTAATTTSTPSGTTTPGRGGLPEGANDYAVATFTAWQQGDLASLAELATPPVVAFLSAASPGQGQWEGPQFEGAAGSTYSSWTRPEMQFVVRVRNEMASAGEPHAAIQAFFWSAPGRVAIWPFTTQEEANSTQQQVDQGHQPWLADPAAVASSYAQAELGWDDAAVEMVRPGGYEVTDPQSGAQAALVLSQPARAGEGGIWAITRAGSV